MTLPALQKTWQGGSTPGGTDLVNQVLDGGADAIEKDVLFAIKESLINFDASAWTVVGSSDATAASMDGTDRWNVAGDLQWPTTLGQDYSWIVLQQAGVNAKFQVLFGMDTILADDAGREDITIVVSPAAGFGTANGGTDGSKNSLPTATDSYVQFAEGWLAGIGASMISCIMSDDGECTRIIAERSTGVMHAMLGFEKPKGPHVSWADPCVSYVVAVATGVFLQAFWQDLAVFKTSFGSAIITGPNVLNTEVVNWDEEQSCHLWGGSLRDQREPFARGTLFDWYWNSAQGTEAASPKDSYPAAGDRSFVCLGDFSIGWLDDSATDVNIAQPEFVAVTTGTLTSGGSSSITINKPAGVQEGDLLIFVCLGIENDSYLSAHPAGWTVEVDDFAVMDAVNSYQNMDYKVAGASEPASYTWTRQGVTAKSLFAILAYRKGHLTQLDGSALTALVASNAVHSQLGQVTSYPQDLVVNSWLVNGNGFAGFTSGVPSGGTSTARVVLDGAAVGRSDLKILVYDEPFVNEGAQPSRSITHSIAAAGKMISAAIRAFGAN